MRLAHFSDIHVTVNPLTQPLLQLASKRAMGTLNYFVGGRGRHFTGVDTRILALLEDVDAQDVDHVICTGDVTQMSYEVEFERCAALFGDRLDAPTRYTVIPGNHDRYTSGADRNRRFERWFGRVSEQGDYPFVKSAGEGVTIVGLDVSRPTALTDSSGYCGPAQLSRLRDIVTDPSLADQFVVVALHYALLRADGRPDRKSHGIRDLDELLAVIDADTARVDMVLHGHIHRSYTVSSARRPLICAGSATDLYLRCGYNVYDIDLESRTFRTSRRSWDTERRGYVAGE